MEEKIKKLKEMIQKEALYKTDGERGAVLRSDNPQKWLFDIRQICLKPEFLDLATDIFWEIFEKDYPFQIGGQELTAVPLAASIALQGKKIGKPVNGFIVRKSRKTTGLRRMIEGKITGEKIILLDDAVNSGRTILQGIKKIEQAGGTVDTAFFLVDCGEGMGPKAFDKQRIKFHHLLNLSDFDLTLPKREIINSGFQEVWHFQSPDPNYFHIVPKSAPCLDEKKIYFGSDSGWFWALNQNDGSVVWKFKTGYHIQGKSIFSSPVIHKGKIYFGSYDGNVYALEKDSGKMKWKFGEADWIGSSPAVAPDLNLLFIGLEFGLWKKQGGLAAIDLETGEKRWDFRMSDFVHCSPAYCPEKKLVAVGGNDFCAYLFDAKNGKLKLKFETGGEIKASFSFDAEKNLILFGSFDGCLYALDLDSGELKGKFETKDYIYSTPKVHGNNVYFTSTDKNLYSVSLDTGKLNWRFTTNGRIFASPEIIGDKILFGATDGKLYEIDIKTGQWTSFFQTTERIMNKIAYNPKTKRIFLLTYANEIYCLGKEPYSN